MAAAEHDSDGWTGALRRLGDSLAGLLQTRFELFALELQEEKLRALSLLAWLGLAFALLLAGSLVALGTLALFLWEVAGYYGLAGFAAAALAGSAAVLLLIRRRILRGPAPLAATAAEFGKDYECLRNKN